MRKHWAMLITCLLLGFALTEGSAASNETVDFSGKWVFNASKSAGIPPRMPEFKVFTKTVTQNQQLHQLSVTTDLIMGRFSDRPKGGPAGYLPLTVRTAT